MDDKILDAIFTRDFSGLSEPPPEKASELIEPTAGKKRKTEKHDESTAATVKQLEKQGVLLAESGDVAAAERVFGEAIILAPYSASARNNRAQARRMLGNLTGARDDLDAAIEATDDAAVLRMAYTQRAIVRKNLGDRDGADADLLQGARYGNILAKAALKDANPYAKMCSAMVTEIMQKYK
ncbi:Tetratricopeptide repeat protein 36 [Physocladia obscura]|uniref:Tetratricopeptide repeat protein 36 n=1 Tax=Physocladia obscura TaxID=109957 RepID=A0AAD5TCE5_9FUNG|nr:Tetratricopeptide repeat protein 36 [Physocladia obscura]